MINPEMSHRFSYIVYYRHKNNSLSSEPSMLHKLLLPGVLIVVMATLATYLNPFSNEMFDFHDQTQPARIEEFVEELQKGHIPPRIADDFSFQMGYPLFTYYAPFSYLITSVFVLLGFSVIQALKISFALAIAVAFTSMYLYLRRFFERDGSYVGAAVYITIPYFAVEIFVRGNLGEVWFLALFPLVLYLFHLLEEVPRRWIVVCTVCAVSAILTVHNVFSLVSLPLLLAYAWFTTDRRRTYGIISTGFLLSSYFLIPAVLESGLTYAGSVAKQTEYALHFLCPSQLWSGIWGYGGSVEGCVLDGMSFKLGKLQLLLTAFGLLIFLPKIRQIWKKPYMRRDGVYIGMFTLLAGSIFMTLAISQPIWELFEPILALFQFPWRFLVLAMVGMAFFSAYGIDRIQFFWKLAPALVVVVALLIINEKYFYKPTMPATAFTEKYLTEKYIETEVAFRVPEYFPRTGTFEEWFSYFQNPDKITNLQDETRYLITALDDSEVAAEASASADMIRTVTHDTFNGIFIEIPLEPGLYRINLHDIPNWRYLVNGNQTVTTHTENMDIAVIESEDTSFTYTTDDLARPIFQVMEPVTLSIAYTQSRWQLVGTILSVITIIGLACYLFLKDLPTLVAKLTAKTASSQRQEPG